MFKPSSLFDGTPPIRIALFIILALHIRPKNAFCAPSRLSNRLIYSILHDCCYIIMAFLTTSSQLPPATLYPPSGLYTPADNLSYNQNTVPPAPEWPMLSEWRRPLSLYDSNNDSVAQPQPPWQPNKKRHIESVAEAGGGYFPTSSSKKPRTLKRAKNAIRETPGFACPLYKRNPSKFGGPRGCADWCTLEIHRLYSVG